MELIQSPVALPGCCFICRAAQRDMYVDTGVSLAFEGAFYICNLCQNEMAHLMGYISEQEYKDLRAAKEEADRINYELIKRVGGLEESLRALANAGYNYKPDVGVVIDGGYRGQAVEDDSSKSPGRKKSVGAREGKAPEPSNDEGMAELHSNDGDSEFVLEF